MRRRAFLLALVFITLLPVAAAMCPVIYTPPNSFVHLTDQTQGLVAYNEDRDLQRFVIRQAYEGVASDFGLVLPTPGEPNFTARDEQLFKQLHDMTKEPVDRDRGGLNGIQTQALNQRERDVQVIKTRNVGDFKATVLKADNAQALVDWLRRHNYNFGQASRKNFQYYIDKGGFYFTALKINVNRANCLTQEEYRKWQDMDPRLRDRFGQPGGSYNGGRCYLVGGLQPVEFRFHAENPMLPLRIMARPHDDSPLTGGDHENHQHKPGNFLIYTLSDQPLVIPGAKVEYAQRIGSPGGKLAKYTSAGRFLVRQRFKFDARKVDHDLTFKQAAPFFVPREGSRVIEPDKTDTPNGMIAFSGNAIDVSFTRHPSPIAGINYRTSKVSHTAKEGVQAFAGIITVLLPVLGVTAGLVTSIPSILLLLLLPLTFGLLWSRLKALRAVFFGTYIGLFLAGIVFLLFTVATQRGGGESIGMFLLSVLVLGALPASLGGVLAYLISHFGFSHERIRELQSRMDDLHPWKSVTAVVASILTAAILSTGSMIMLTRTGTEKILPLILPFAITPPLAAYVVQQLHGREDVNIIEQDATDWQWFAVTAGLLVLMLLTVSLLLTVQRSTAFIA